MKCAGLHIRRKGLFYPAPGATRIQSAPVRMVEKDGAIPRLSEWRWIHTLGHTPRRVSLYREKNRGLLPGDAFCTGDQRSLLAVAWQRPELHGPPSFRAETRRAAPFSSGAESAGDG